MQHLPVASELSHESLIQLVPAIVAQIKEAVALLAEMRPLEPEHFLMEYFSEKPSIDNFRDSSCVSEITPEHRRDFCGWHLEERSLKIAMWAQYPSFSDHVCASYIHASQRCKRIQQSQIQEGLIRAKSENISSTTVNVAPNPAIKHSPTFAHVIRLFCGVSTNEAVSSWIRAQIEQIFSQQNTRDEKTAVHHSLRQNHTCPFDAFYELALALRKVHRWYYHIQLLFILLSDENGAPRKATRVRNLRALLEETQRRLILQSNSEGKHQLCTTNSVRNCNATLKTILDECTLSEDSNISWNAFVHIFMTTFTYMQSVLNQGSMVSLPRISNPQGSTPMHSELVEPQHASL